MRAVLLCLVMLSGFFGTGAAWGQDTQKELHVAAAADLQPVMPVLAAAYEHATGIKLVVSYGSSATLTTQILNGAPMDIFLAADFVFPEKVVAAGLSDMKQPTAYAKGALVLWARKDSPLQPISMDKLTDPRVTRIAIANEEHAPYGRAAVAALKKLNLYDKVSSHLVVAENIAQTAQFVESGNAQLGLISLTTANTPHFSQIGTYVRVPTVYPELRQCAVVMAKSEHRAEAHAFLDWLLTPAVQGNMSKLGLAAVQ
ncbi:MAG TPA: molybdate ABC transporter substrate-binding protein [Edaphobacter sp.]|uniref:molybdate ABC transporter substrate-binding protein n=1 Tax=Edaphobacter sp. TaxID=1934404 RepID=UPI002CFA148D|nr:molybdate ABC transporter substrate-binding protein [Edaphobacter sp.]HUZ95672.1 molybdate ABC transporter substrate-binding protein [Edaphobacter sp.]